MTFNATFADSRAQFTAKLTDNNTSLASDFGEAYIMHIDEYDGEYEVTPTSYAQVLETEGKVMTQNVTVNPIPSNYGLITWNGIYITVS